ncbi:hypothetical protein ACA910_007607 [Epithemia clementina (nom. ined.)]
MVHSTSSSSSATTSTTTTLHGSSLLMGSASLVSRSDDWGNWMVLVFNTALAQYLSRTTSLGALLGPPIGAMFWTFFMATVGILPAGGTAASSALQTLTLYMATPLVLLGVANDFRRQQLRSISNQSDDYEYDDDYDDDSVTKMNEQTQSTIQASGQSPVQRLRRWFRLEKAQANGSATKKRRRRPGGGGGEPLYTSFAVAALATIGASMVGWMVLRPALVSAMGAEDALKVVAALMARNVGGGLNYIAVCTTLQASPSAITAGMCADNIFGLVYFPILSYFALGRQDPAVAEEEEREQRQARRQRKAATAYELNRTKLPATVSILDKANTLEAEGVIVSSLSSQNTLSNTATTTGRKQEQSAASVTSKRKKSNRPVVSAETLSSPMSTSPTDVTLTFDDRNVRDLLVLEKKKSKSDKKKQPNKNGTDELVNGNAIRAHGHVNGMAHGHVNGVVNGHVNGVVNGQVNGKVNGKVKGMVNDNSNGLYVNGKDGSSASADTDAALDTADPTIPEDNTISVDRVMYVLFTASFLVWLSRLIGGVRASLPVCTVLSVLLIKVVTMSQAPSWFFGAPRWLPAANRWIASIQPTAQVLGTVTLHIFFSTLGAQGGRAVSTLKSSMIPLGAFELMLYMLHGTWLWACHKSFPNRRWASAPRLLMGSSAAIGGPATAVALAQSNSWQSLQVPGLLVGNIGDMIGTFLGIAFFALFSFTIKPSSLM